jgi:(p)ppGpp synthase/HD superfamily hydrolase
MNRDTFFIAMAERFSADDLTYIQRAYWLVKEAHRKQNRRLTGERYFEHVRRVATYAFDRYNYSDPELIALGLLHDVVEDTFVPQSVIVNLFGRLMYDWILVLSKEVPVFHPVTGKLLGRVKIPTEVYFENLKNTHLNPRIVKGCDRYDNLADFAQWEAPRKAKYVTETNDFILPLIRTTDHRIANDIEARLAQ